MSTRRKNVIMACFVAMTILSYRLGYLTAQSKG